MANEIINPEIISALVLGGDVSKLNAVQKVQYYNKLCENIGLNPLTQPFKLLKLQGKEVLYADKGATQQLCQIHNISTEVTKKERIDDVYVVTVRASNDKGRFTDEDGVVSIGNLKGDMLANALMKAVTKAKRRAVLAFCGLGMLDETEIETIPNAVISKPEVEIPKEIEMKEPTKNSKPAKTAVNIPKQENNPQNELDTITAKEAVYLVNLAKQHNWSQGDFKLQLLKLGYDSTIKILQQDYGTFVSTFGKPFQKVEELEEIDDVISPKEELETEWEKEEK